VSTGRPQSGQLTKSVSLVFVTWLNDDNNSVPQHKIQESPLGLSACRWESKIWLTYWAIFAEGSKHCALKAKMPFVIHESAAGGAPFLAFFASRLWHDGRFLCSSDKECETWKFTT
jgi:hypothetical protein